ncbi:MAG: response regulator [Burkholderiales bacterium]
MGTRIVLADDHRLIREGISSLLRQENDIEIVGEAADGAEVVRLARKLRPELVITDISMPGLNGIEAIKQMVSDAPMIKILCLSVHDEKSMIAAVMDSGAAGYLLKDCAYEELIRAVRTVLSRQVYISPGIAGILIQEYRDRKGAERRSVFTELTGREREVVQLIAEGQSTKEIADRLHLSAKTIGTHREHILQKLSLKGTADLTRYAIREGLASLNGLTRGRSSTT